MKFMTYYQHYILYCDLISKHSSEEGAFSIIKRYNKLLETCQEILEKEC
ncbi:6521_t:CDS:1, partial [Entrophospora sp. SA101]